jgi:hypothetical protein
VETYWSFICENLHVWKWPRRKKNLICWPVFTSLREFIKKGTRPVLTKLCKNRIRPDLKEKWNPPNADPKIKVARDSKLEMNWLSHLLVLFLHLVTCRVLISHLGDTKNLVKFSKILAKLVKFILRKLNFPNFLWSHVEMLQVSWPHPIRSSLLCFFQTSMHHSSGKTEL